MKGYIVTPCLVGIMFLMNTCAVNPVTGKRQVVLMSEAQEVAMGQEADPQIIAQYGLYEDKELQNFINQKGQAMAAVSHRPNLDYKFRIVDSDVINAFAVPGGYVYFTRGIMAHFNNEAQFAGVLGHEIGHITARHSVIQQRNALLGQVGLIAGMVISPEFGQFAQQASQGLGLLFLKFGRDDERQSDELGVEYSTKIGYDAQHMADFFTTLERSSARSGAEELPDFLSSHPNPGSRNASVNNLAAEWKKKLNVTNLQENRNDYLRRIDGIIYGEDPKQGFVENSAFYHPVLKFQFQIPTGWAHQNSPQTFQMAPRDGNAMMMLTMAPGKTLQEAASAVLQQNNLTAVESRETTVNGLRAIVMIADQRQEQGSLRTLSYLIQYGDAIYLMLGVSSLANFNTYSQYFSNSMQSFRQLTDQAKINKKPERVRIKTVKQAGTVDQALRSLNVPSNRLEELAILNGMKLSDRVSTGTLIKVIEQ
jgi:predicted Zn-dependent protease